MVKKTQNKIDIKNSLSPSDPPSAPAPSPLLINSLWEKKKVAVPGGAAAVGLGTGLLRTIAIKETLALTHSGHVQNINNVLP